MPNLKTMLLTSAVKQIIDKSVLCWLATCSLDGEPNVSPKEMFTYAADDTLIIANVASPHTIHNISENPKVCVSMVDIFTQKGYKLKGRAVLIEPDNAHYSVLVQPLHALFTDQYPIKSIMQIKVERVATIVAPSYWLYPDRSEAKQIENALSTYGVEFTK